MVMPRDADKACYRMCNPNNVCSRYHTVLELGIQEVILPPIKDSVGEMAHPLNDEAWESICSLDIASVHDCLLQELHFVNLRD
jgi:hypothetical protein